MTTDFVTHLQRELVRRCEQNPRYSLRAFARSLQMDASTLSQVLRGKRALTVKARRKLGLALGLNPSEFESDPKHVTKKSPKPMRELSAELFAVISDWYHDAILELTRLPGFHGKSRWIARRLGINPAQVQVAVQRLKKLEFLEVTASGKWINRLNNNTTIVQNDLTSAALRKLQKQILELSMDALENVPKAKRDHTSMLMTVDPADLDEIKKRIRSFRRELLEYCERKGARPKELYQFAVSIFPLTKE